MQTNAITATDEPAASVAAMPLLMAADIQDHLLMASNDLERLQRLLSDTCDTLLARFSSAISDLGACMPVAAAPPALAGVQRQLGEAVTALQFQDMASQLIAHTHQRLRNCADQLARDVFGADADGDAVIAPPPLRPNPVTQDEMDAGSIELF